MGRMHAYSAQAYWEGRVSDGKEKTLIQDRFVHLNVRGAQYRVHPDVVRIYRN